MKKRVLSMVLALSMMLTLFPASAFAAGDTGGGISPDQATPQSVDTENAAGLTSATTITAEQVANGGYVISDGGEYILTGGNYRGNYILINTSDDVTLNLADDITCPDGNFLFVDGDDSPSCNIVINGNGHAITGTGNAFSGLISIMDSAATVKLNNVLLNSKDNSAISMSSDAAALDLTINSSKLLSSSSPTVELGSSSAASTLTIKGASVISSNSDSSNAHVVDLYGRCNFNLMSNSTIQGGAVGVYVNANTNNASTSIYIDCSTIENAAVAGVQWAALNSDSDSFSLSKSAFTNNTVDILLPNVDSDDSNSDNNVTFSVLEKLTSDVIFSFPDAKGSFFAGSNQVYDAADAAETFEHLKADTGTFEKDDDGNITYIKASSTTKKDPDAANYVIKTKNTTSGKDSITAGDNYSIVVDVNDTGFNAGAAPWNDEYAIEYRAAGTEEWDTTLPKEPGTYYVQFYVDGNSSFNAGWVSGEDLKFTIGKATWSLSDFDYDRATGYVYPTGSAGDDTVRITMVYYNSNNQVVSKGSIPSELGTYKVGFIVEESTSYAEFDSNGPVSDWTYTVKPAPEAKDFKVTLTVNQTEKHELGTEAVTVPYNDRNNYTVTGASATGSSLGYIEIYYVDTATQGYRFSAPTTPGTYQVYLEVSDTDTHAGGRVTSDKWVFTIGTPKQDPPENAYVPRLNGDSFINPNYEDVKGKTLAELGIEAERNIPDDTADYGETSLHFYSEYTYGSGFGAEISADTVPEIGKTYYVTVKTAGNDAYNAREYTQVYGHIIVRYAPKADNYKVTVTFDGTPYDLANVTAPVVVPSGTTYTVGNEIRNTSADVGRIYEVSYRAADSTDDDAWSSTLPDEPGKYQISLGIYNSDTYNSAQHLTSDKWVFTIGQAELDDATIKSSFTFVDGKVTASDALTGKVGDITVVYYDSNNKVVSEGKAPTEPGEYKVGFKMTESDSYKAYDSNGPVNGWTYTVKAAPEPQNYTVRLNGVDVTKLTVDNGLVYNKRLVIAAEANKGVTTGAVLGIYVAPVQANGKADLTNLYENDPDLLKLLLVPGNYQVVLNVAESDATRVDELFTSSNWHFTINKATVDKADYSKFTYDADAQTITVPSAYSAHISSDDITVLYYQNDKVVSKGTAPTEPGTYQVGFSIQETMYYKALEGTGPVSNWTYIVKDAPKAENYEVTVNGFDITELDAPIKYQQQITVEAEAKPGTGTGDVHSDTIQYALVLADGKPDFDHAVSSGTLVPGTYQVRFEVTGSNLYNSGYVTDPAWRFTVEKKELDATSTEITNIQYDPTTNTFSSLPYGVKAEDVTIQYYQDGMLVEDLVKDANGKLVPRVAGTYQVGFSLSDSLCYQKYDSNGPVADWEYTVQPHFISLKDFDVTVGGKTYDGKPVEVSVTAHDGILPVGEVTVIYVNEATGEQSETAPTEVGSYHCIVKVADNFNNHGFTTSTQSFTIDQNTDLDDAITVNVPTNVREGDESGFDVTVTINDATLTADDLEITYVAEDGTESTEAPTKAGVHTYKITVKDTAKNYTAGSVLSGNYTIYSTEPTITGGELTTEDGSLPAPGTKVTIKAPEDTDTNVFQQWVISVDGVEVQPTAKDLKEKLGVDVEDNDAALAALQDPEFTFTMPEGKLSIYALTSNPQQEAFEKAVGTTLIVGGAAAATGAVYYFGTTAYIRSQLPEGMAVPQNREQLAVALWTLAGKPATESTAVFTDVAADSEALPAIRWAVETGVLNAKTTEDGTTFLAGNYVTRAETAYRIYKLQQQRAQ